jgi:hypothetical protein
MEEATLLESPGEAPKGESSDKIILGDPSGNPKPLGCPSILLQDEEDGIISDSSESTLKEASISPKGAESDSGASTITLGSVSSKMRMLTTATRPSGAARRSRKKKGVEGSKKGWGSNGGTCTLYF